ncbi:hypothetical protein ASE60_19075 [Ensifer sp. Root278]|nr:hypothetical protein ASE60_19075 [Ensifer sp. Root278]
MNADTMFAQQGDETPVRQFIGHKRIDIGKRGKAHRRAPAELAAVDRQDHARGLLHGGRDGGDFGMVVVADVAVLVYAADGDDRDVELPRPSASTTPGRLRRASPTTASTPSSR